MHICDDFDDFDFGADALPAPTLVGETILCDWCKVAGGYEVLIACAEGCLFSIYLCTPHFAMAAMKGVGIMPACECDDVLSPCKGEVSH